MIAANEIRIGNYVSLKCGTHVPIADGGILAISQKRFECSPIPLTTEILEKCGFVKPSKNDNHGGLLVSIGNDVSIRLKPLISGEGYYWDNFNGAYKVIIKHLHQLQNLYWCLCGKELEINLQ